MMMTNKYPLPPLPEPLCNLPTYCQDAVRQYTRSVLDDHLNEQDAAIEAALASPEIKTMQCMAECMDMVRAELIELGVIGKNVPPMFVASAVFEHVQALRKDAERLDFMISEECQIQSLSTPNEVRHRLYWPDADEAQCEWFTNPRAAIDTAMEKQK